MSPAQDSPSKEGSSYDERNGNLGVDEDGKIDSAHENDVNGDAPSMDTVEESSEPEYYSELREACRQANLAQIRQIISQNSTIDLNIRDPEQGYTPLLEIITEGIYSEDAEEACNAVRFLVSQGADVNVKDTEGYTGLHHCARVDTDPSLHLAQVLIELGADVNADQRPVVKAQVDGSDGHGGEGDHGNQDDGCECGQHIGVVLNAAFKSATGQELNTQDQYKELDVTPLHHACGYGNNIPIAKLLLENGAKIDISDNVAGIPLLGAIKQSREGICALLLGWPGGTGLLSKHDRHGRLPIHYAAEVSNREIVAMLIESGSLVDPVIRGDDVQEHEKGFTPLMLACKNAARKGRVEVIEYLLDHGADALKTGGRGQTPLLLSVLAKSVEAARLLVKHGADPKAAVGGFEDVNALHIAATSGSADLCKWLVEEANISVHSHDDQGYTALINAAGYSNSPETIRLLVSTLHADIEATIHDGRRPLHFAAFKGQLACAEELIALGADKEAVDDAGWTPLHFAARYHHQEVIQLLLKSGAEVGKTVEGGPQPKRVDGEDFDICGFTAADLARIIRGGQECVDILVAAGDTLSEETKNLKDDDLWKEEPMTCCVM